MPLSLCMFEAESKISIAYENVFVLTWYFNEVNRTNNYFIRSQEQLFYSYVK